MCPLPNTRVIPPGWSQHHHRTAEGGFTAVAQVIRPGGPVGWDPETGPAPADPEDVIHDGPCRVQVLENATRTGDAAGQEITHTDYLVAFEHDLPPVRVGDGGDIVKVTECADDPHLVDRPLRVVNVTLGSLRWQRDLTCRDDLTANNPPA